MAACTVLALPSPGRAGGVRRPLPEDPVEERVQVLDGTTGWPLAGAAAVPGRREPDRGLRAGDLPRVTLPPGWVPGDDGVREAPTVSRFTRVVLRTVVAWPEMDVRIRVVDAEDRPVAGALVDLLGSIVRRTSASDGGRFFCRRTSWSCRSSATVRTGEDGVARPRGLPAIPGHRWTPRAEEVEERAGAGEPWTVEDPRAVVERTVVLREGARGLDHGAGAMIGGGRPAPPVPGSETAAIRVLHLDGEPARGVRVVAGGNAEGRAWTRWMCTAPDGVAEFRDLPPGPARVRVEEPGFVSGEAAEITAGPGSVARATLREVPGRSVIVRVLDPAGRPRPGARVAVLSAAAPYAAVDAFGVQDADPVTDAAGLVLLPRVPPGRLRVRAELGDRRGTAAGDGERLEIVLRP